MKLNYLIKVTPFLSTLLLIIFLGISNNKEYTKLRILIWNTPSLTLGAYIAISTGSGFIFSYLLTNTIARTNQNTTKKSLRFRDDDKFVDINEFTDTNISYDNTLIERDIKDPSPTINASFRIIGKTERNNKNTINNNINVTHGDSSHSDEEYNEEAEKNVTIKNASAISSDWNDESYSSW